MLQYYSKLQDEEEQDLQDSPQPIHVGPLDRIRREEIMCKELDFAGFEEIRRLLWPHLLLALPDDFGPIFDNTVEVGVDAEKLHDEAANSTANIDNSCAMWQFMPWEVCRDDQREFLSCISYENEPYGWEALIALPPPTMASPKISNSGRGIFPSTSGTRCAN